MKLGHAFVMALVLASAGPPALAQSGKDKMPGAVVAVSPFNVSLLYGRWGDDGDCNKDILFRPNGTFLSYTGGEGNWSVDGENLVLQGAGGRFDLIVRWTDRDHMDLVHPDGAVGHSQRC
jgi:hypothetical protein